MALHELVKIVRRKRRRGRGIGKGGAKSGRGMKGQRARAGSHSKAGFEGGQTPLYMRLPKNRGMKQKFAPQTEKLEAVNIRVLEHFTSKMIVGPTQLLQLKLISNRQSKVKLIGTQALSVPLTLRAHAVSSGAKAAIEKAGGKVELIGG